MREVRVFYAYDDTEFFDRDECRAYEEQAIELFKEIDNKYSFFDENMNLLEAPPIGSDIEQWIDWLNKSADKCKIIYRDGDLSFDADKLVSEVCAYGINNSDFPYGEDNVGWFKWEDCDWVKVDE